MDQGARSRRSIPSGIVYIDELGVDTETVTNEIIAQHGINDDPGEGVFTR
jgi:hypothetical protein